MIVDFKEVIPDKTLPRFNCQKRFWTAPAKLVVEKVNNFYVISYDIELVKGRFRKYSMQVPSRVVIDSKFLVALAMYTCEGRNPNKGVYTNSSANKGRYLSIINSDSRIIKFVIDEFESKLGIERNRWKYRLTLFSNQNVEKEKNWWSRSLKIKKGRFVIAEVVPGNKEKVTYASHGRCSAELSSVIHAAIIYNLCEKLLNNTLLKENF